MAKKFIRKLTRVSSHSYALTIPKELVKAFRWKERQKIEIVFGGRKHEFIVRDWVPKKSRKNLSMRLRTTLRDRKRK